MPTRLASIRVCPRCGFSHLRPSRPHTVAERVQRWWTRTRWFRCETCKWRGRLNDVWSPDEAFPELPPLRLGRELDIEILQQRDEDSLIDLVLARADEIGQSLRVWLDDSRPAPPGWIRVTAVPRAQRLCAAALVREISLDYDLGWCADCIHRGEHLKHSGMRHCPHTATGYDLVRWMAETGHWSKLPPSVHSGNLEGGAKMLGLIARHWHGDTLISPPSLPGEDAVAPPADAAQPREPARPEAPDDADHDAAVAALTTCPNCHGPYLYRAHRHSNVERLRSLVTRTFPVRCSACGWTRWIGAPILVRFSSGGDPDTPPIDAERIEQIDPD